MSQDENPLGRYLLFYQLIDKTEALNPTLHIQLDPGYGSQISFDLLHEQRPRKIKAFSLFWKKPLLSLSIDDGDIVFIHAIADEGTVTAGGIWQVRWRNDSYHGGSDGYVFGEVTSSGIDMVEVETLLQEEEYTLFDDAVAYAKTFLKEQGGVSHRDFVDGREIGASAPERIHQVTPLPSDIRAIEHTWLFVLSGHKTYTSRTLFFLMEVRYRFQNQEWHYSASLLREGDDYETWFV